MTATSFLFVLLSQLSWALPSNKAKPESPSIALPSWCNKSAPFFSSRRTENGQVILTRIYQQTVTRDGGHLVYSRVFLAEMDSLSDSLLWKAKDFIYSHDMLSFDLFRPSITVADIDGDNRAETFAGYIVETQAGGDPTTVKFVAQKDREVYSITVKIPMMEDDADRYRITYSSAFKTATPRFRQATDSLLKQFVMKGIKAKKFGGFLPYQLGGKRHQNDD